MLKKTLLIILSLLLGMVLGITLLFSTDKQINSLNLPLFSPLVGFKPTVIGFMPYWLIGKSNYYDKKITTLTYFSLTIDSDGKILKLLNPVEEEPGFTTLKKDDVDKIFTQAKKKKIKTSLLLHNSDEESIAQLLENPVLSAQNLISEVSPIMKQYGFSDLNLDIESFKNASESTQIPFTQFITEVKKGLIENNLGTLTIELTPTSLIKTRLINPQQLGQIADFVVLMAYDYHYIYSYLAGPVAPINGNGINSEFDVETAVQQALNIIPANKIILGIPLYGYEWDTISSIPGSPTVPGTGKTASSKRVEEILKDCQNCTEGFDDIALEPYLIISENDYYRQIFYEDKRSLEKKLELVKKYKLGGTAFWALGYEDSTILNVL